MMMITMRMNFPYVAELIFCCLRRVMKSAEYPQDTHLLITIVLRNVEYGANIHQT